MKLSCSLFAASIAVALLPFVSAHGSPSRMVANGKSYDGPFPAGQQIASPVRMISHLEPIKDVTSHDMFCGYGADSTASEIAPVTAGSSVQFFYRSGNEGTPWPHIYGPMMTYMAKCPSTADKCNSASLKWFKTGQLGLRPDGSWFQAEINQNHAVNTTIPQQIEDGDYLIRNEIIALHNAMTVGAAEFYVACAQVRVSGGQGMTPPASDLVSFPGAYNANDKGIHVDIYTNFHSYTFPGPALAFTGGSGGAANAAGSPTASAPATKATGPSRQHKCAVQRHKRSMSRVMRRMAPADLSLDA